MHLNKKLRLVQLIICIGISSTSLFSNTNIIIPDDELLVDRLISQTEQEKDELILLKKDWQIVDIILKEDYQDIVKISIDGINEIWNMDDSALNDDSEIMNSVIEFMNERMKISDSYGTRKINSIEPERYLSRKKGDYPDYLRGLSFIPIGKTGTYSFMKENYTFEKMTKELDSLKKLIEESFVEIEQKIESIDGEISGKDSMLRDLLKNRNKSGDLQSLTIYLGLPLFCMTILLLFLFPYYLENKNRDDNTDRNDKTRKILLDIATVLLLTMTILILGLSNMLNSDVLGTLLGGISGYVLNRNFNTT